MTFQKEAIEAVGGDWSEIDEMNSALKELRQKRRSSIEPGGEFSYSKVAWKIGGFQQAILYRIVMLAEGCSSMWNTRNILGSILCARALIETVALIFDFEKQLQRFCENNDLSAIDSLVMNRTFSTRLEGWYEQADNTQATNILGHIDKLEKLIEGARHHYDLLSEICHPNSLGHNFLFGKLDQETARVNLSETICFRQDMLHHILAAFCLIRLADNCINKIDKLIPTVIMISESARKKEGKLE